MYSRFVLSKLCSLNCAIYGNSWERIKYHYDFMSISKISFCVLFLARMCVFLFIIMYNKYMYTGWPKKNATILIRYFNDILD